MNPRVAVLVVVIAILVIALLVWLTRPSSSRPASPFCLSLWEDPMTTTAQRPDLRAVAVDASNEACGAVTRTMTAAYPGLPPLRWIQQAPAFALVGKASHDLDGEAARAAATAWAAALGLTPAPTAVAGVVEYTGVVDDVPVEVWAVVDRPLFEAGR